MEGGPLKTPFTQTAVSRAIAAAKKAGLHVVAIRPDGTVIVSEKPVDPAAPALDEWSIFQA